MRRTEQTICMTGDWRTPSSTTGTVTRQATRMKRAPANRNTIRRQTTTQRRQKQASSKKGKPDAKTEGLSFADEIAYETEDDDDEIDDRWEALVGHEEGDAAGGY